MPMDTKLPMIPKSDLEHVLKAIDSYITRLASSLISYSFL